MTNSITPVNSTPQAPVESAATVATNNTPNPSIFTPAPVESAATVASFSAMA